MNAIPMVSINGLLSYWRNTLADEDLMGLGSTDSSISVGADVIRSGRLAEESVKLLQGAWEKFKKSSDQTPADLANPFKGAVPIIIFSRGFGPDYKHGKSVGGKAPQRPHYTLHIPAVLESSGSLSFSPDSVPWIGRQYLLPNEEAEANLPLVGQLDAFDDWLNGNPLEDASWDEVMKWSDGLWDKVAGHRTPDGFMALEDAKVDIARSVRNASQNLCQLYDALRVEETVPELFSRVCRGFPNPLIVNADVRRRHLAAPRGAMSTAHGLADSQSDAVAAFATLASGEVLAVNGPPGTGKTTLLQSVVATEVVWSAMEGGEPAVIVGTSTNNQAVTNINQSLNGILKENPAVAQFSWAKRWLPNAETYGLYLPAGNDKADAAVKNGYAVAVKKGQMWSGFPEKENDPAYLESARQAWVKGYLNTYGQEPEMIDAGLERLRADLAEVAKEVQGVSETLERLSVIEDWWRGIAGDLMPEPFIQKTDAALTATIAHLIEAHEEAATVVETAQAGRDAASARMGEAFAVEPDLADQQAFVTQLIGRKTKISAALAPHGFLEAIATLFPPLQKAADHKRIARLCELAEQDALIRQLFEEEVRNDEPAAWTARIKLLMQEATADLSTLHASRSQEEHRRKSDLAQAEEQLSAALERRKAAAESIEEARRNREARLAALEAKMRELSARRENARNVYETLHARAVSEFSVKAAAARPVPAVPTVNDFDWLLDVTLRHMAFQKAMRYWEGRWIIEAQAVQEGRVKVNSGRAAMEARFRRWCMLTPCLIITLHSLPKHFRFKSKMGDAWASNFMLGFIDVLIMDEAGQVGPHIGAAAFALAKRAVVVGDIYQIEPVSRVSRGTDYANSLRHGLGSMWDDDQPASPHLVSEPSDGGPRGSIMRLAQRATSAASPRTISEPGIFLTEHRRCRAEIVEYCNKLVYGGRLKPLSPPRAKNPPLPPIAWAHVRGNAMKAGGSNVNGLEAQAIAGWIASNADEWRRYYGKPIHEIVAVVTPFRPQARLVEEALRGAGKEHAKITVGTVHSLQGAERPIVVFSPTYGADTANSLFFDLKPNMLNVAVSRAKDSFVVIGDMRLFRRTGDKPASILGGLLFVSEENELTDVDGNYRFPREVAVQGERISTLQRHRDVLRNALAQATASQLIVIVSPWITKKAVADDDLVALVAGAVQDRGAQVRIIVDRELASRTPKSGAAEAISEMKRAGAAVHAVAGLHNKTLIIGDSEIVEGSFNWLSANRQRGDKFVRHETTWRISGPSAAPIIKNALQEFAALGAG